MSEQKVWVEKMPEYCDECPCSQRGKDDYAYCNLLHKNIGYDFGKIPKHCQLIDIKDHDRELVKEVCEKIKEQLGFIVDGQERIVCDGSATGDKTILAVLNQIQKEFEK